MTEEHFKLTFANQLTQFSYRGLYYKEEKVSVNERGNIEIQTKYYIATHQAIRRSKPDSHYNNPRWLEITRDSYMRRRDNMIYAMFDIFKLKCN